MFIIEIFISIIYGIIEGITEWLPISSTGHLILIQDFIQYKNQSPAFMEMFNVVIQLGAILAVVVIYFDKLNPFKPGKSARQVQKTWQLWAKVVVGGPAAPRFRLYRNRSVRKAWQGHPLLPVRFFPTISPCMPQAEMRTYIYTISKLIKRFF